MPPSRLACLPPPLLRLVLLTTLPTTVCTAGCAQCWCGVRLQQLLDTPPSSPSRPQHSLEQRVTRYAQHWHGARLPQLLEEVTKGLK
jgi:hypothetical protein